MSTRRRRDLTTPLRLTPLVVAILLLIGAGVGAMVQGLPWPLDVGGVFLALGLITTWVARDRPMRGALFLLALGVAVITFVYGG